MAAMASADYKLLEEESALPLCVNDGAGNGNAPSSGTAKRRPEEESDVARVIINPSVLDRVLSADRYHFWDDVPVPHGRLLVGADRPMLLSKRERLLRGGGEEGGGSGGDGAVDGVMFGHLWMRFCARLAKTKAEYFSREMRRMCLAGAAWIVMNLLLLIVVVSGSFDVLSVVDFSALAIIAILNVSPMTIRFAALTDRQVQRIVDDMGSSFAEEGYHVDLITSAPMHVRFERAAAPCCVGSHFDPSLRENMSKFQELARSEDQEAAIDDARQEKLRERGRP